MGGGGWRVRGEGRNHEITHILASVIVLFTGTVTSMFAETVPPVLSGLSHKIV
jgi:hypothetical protein